jgi:hypothetical protein
MNKLIATMAAVSALAIATPAAAQYGTGQAYPNSGQGSYRGGNADMNMSARIDQLQMRLQAGVQNGSITRSEAMPLRQQLRQLSQLERQFSRDGIDGRERGELQRRMRDLRMAIRQADGNDQQRWSNYDREDGYSRDGQWSGGYDDRFQPQPQRSVVGGLIDSVFGGGGLQVGQRVPSGLYGLEGGYRDQYRDGNGTFYRTDGRQIYQIDARTQTVVRVHQMRR